MQGQNVQLLEAHEEHKDGAQTAALEQAEGHTEGLGCA